MIQWGDCFKEKSWSPARDASTGNIFERLYNEKNDIKIKHELNRQTKERIWNEEEDKIISYVKDHEPQG